ncbi:MAG: CHAT domain-containing protein [Bacteroidota bacterium]
MLLKIKIFVLLTFLFNINIVAQNQELTTDSITAIELRNEALNHFRNSRFIEAEFFFKKSLNASIRFYGEKNYETGSIYSALGITYRNLGDFEQAIEYFLLAEKAYSQAYEQNKMAIARLYNNIGNVYLNSLDYNTALDYYQRAAAIYLEQKEIDEQGLADIFYNIANIHFQLKNYKEIFQIIEEYLPFSYSDTKLFFLSLKAASLNEAGNTEEAYESYQKVMDYSKELYSETDLNVAFEYINFATFLIYHNNFIEAEKILEKINYIFKENHFEQGLNLAFYYKTLGIYHENLNVETKNIDDFRQQKSANLEEAIRSYEKGLEALNFDLNTLSDDTFDLGQTISLTQTLEFLKLIADTYAQIADVYEDKKQEDYTQSLHKALDYYKVTSDIIQQARREIYSDDSKIQLSALEESTFNKIIQTAFKAYELSNDQEVAEFAFNNAERIKSSAVFDRITDQLAKENSLIPDSLTQLERNLNFRITSNNEKLYNLTSSENSDPDEIAQTDSLLFELKKQREELNQYLEKNYSDFYELKYANSATGISDIQKNLAKEEVVIEYVLNETDSIPELYTFFISPEKFSFTKQNITADFIPEIENTFRFMSNPRYLFTRNEESKQYCISANKLYNALIKPFSALIQDKKITIIPDGKLSYIPFEALLVELPDTSSQIQFAHLPYFIRNNTINYAYSANLHFKFNNLQRKASNKVLAFAPEYKADTVLFENEKINLIPLPGVQREVDLIAKEVKTKVFKGEEASEINFRENSGDFEILHLAMHAFINDSLPAFSRFAFAQNNSETPENDGWFNTADIYNLDLNARLTVLSACNTGSGNLKNGEGVMSLARGFLYAGCPSIIMTQWEVEDNAGTHIMSSFYNNLKKGRPTDEALRLAKLQYLEDANPRMAHPHYWLGYISIGNTTPLFRSYDFYFFGLLLFVILGIAIDQFIRIRKSRK